MDYLPRNIGTHLAIDEVALSQGEQYTNVTNKKAKGTKGSLVIPISLAMTEQVIECVSIDSKKDKPL
jgi:hypothetical protein